MFEFNLINLSETDTPVWYMVDNIIIYIYTLISFFLLSYSLNIVCFGSDIVDPCKINIFCIYILELHRSNSNKPYWYICTYTILVSFWRSSSRFGDGYTIILRLVDTKSDSCPVSTYMKKSFPSIELKERHENVLQYQLPSHACCLARVFDVLANNYEELGIVDFSVSQTTLDQVRMMMMMQLGWKHSNLSISAKGFCNGPDPGCCVNSSK